MYWKQTQHAWQYWPWPTKTNPSKITLNKGYLGKKSLYIKEEHCIVIRFFFLMYYFTVEENSTMNLGYWRQENDQSFCIYQNQLSNTNM